MTGPGERASRRDRATVAAVTTTEAEEAERAPGWYPDPLGRGLERWHDGSHWTPRTRDPGRAWRSLAGPTLVLLPLLVASAVVNGWLAVAFQLRRRVVGGLDAGTRTTDGFRANQDLLADLGVASLALSVGIVVLWLVWFRLATDDARTLRDLRHPRWAFWGWLVPGVNLVLPKRMVDDLWAAGDEERDRDARPRRMPRSLSAWWLTTLAAAVLLVTGARLATAGSADPDDRIRALGEAAGVLRFAAAVAALAALLAAYVVLRLTIRLARRRSREEAAERRTVAP